MGEGRPSGRRGAGGARWRIDAAGALRAMRSSLSSRAGRGEFAAFLKRIRHRTSNGEPLRLDEDPEALRMLRRLGVVEHSTRSSARAGEEAKRFLEEAARSGGPEPAVASVLVRAFASGVYGVVAEPTCGDAPRCDECPLRDMCRERNSPPPAGRRYGPGEGPSERLAEGGPEALSSEELLAVLAGGGARAKESEAAEACERLLRERGGLRGLATALVSELGRSDGLSAQGGRAIAAAMELARRWAAEPRAVGKPFRSAADFFIHYRLRLRDLGKEVFVSVLLDQKNRFLADDVCSEGSLTSSIVHPREVFRRAVRESAAAVAFVHNHPSGDPAPSGPDREITARLADVAKLVGIRMLDHVIVGDTSYFSFAEEGLL
ncbi:MAG: RadC family protein [Planctomycetota bacterium]